LEDVDEKLFSNIIHNKLNVLHHILPGTVAPRTQNIISGLDPTTLS